MKDFRSICIIYNMEDTYRAYYIKEFFKWIGLSYVAVVNKPGRNIFDNEEYYKFDVIVNYNDAIDKDQCQKIEERTKNALVSIDDKDGKSEKKLLEFLINEIIGNKFDGNRMLKGLFMALSKIYDVYDMINLLYEYTFILLSGLPENICDDILERCKTITEEIEKLVKSHINEKRIMGMEYVLYAKYYSIKQVNEFLWIKKRPLKYDTEKYLNEVNEIYNYDKEYFKVEALKGKMAELDPRFSAIPKIFLENAIQGCPIKICKSYHFYTWGKWKERNGELFEANLAYQKAYAADATNFKAIFKLAVEQKKMEQDLSAKNFLEEIINELSVLFINKDEMSLREIEYLYKVFILITEIGEPQFQVQYYEKAEQCMEHINSLIEDSTKNDFTLKMYRSPAVKAIFAETMKRRLKKNLWNCIEDNMGDEDNGETEE